MLKTEQTLIRQNISSLFDIWKKNKKTKNQTLSESFAHFIGVGLPIKYYNEDAFHGYTLKQKYKSIVSILNQEYSRLDNWNNQK